MFSGKHWKKKRVLTEFGFALLCDISLEKKVLEQKASCGFVIKNLQNWSSYILFLGQNAYPANTLS